MEMDSEVNISEKNIFLCVLMVPLGRNSTNNFNSKA